MELPEIPDFTDAPPPPQHIGNPSAVDDDFDLFGPPLKDDGFQHIIDDVATPAPAPHSSDVPEAAADYVDPSERQTSADETPVSSALLAALDAPEASEDAVKSQPITLIPDMVDASIDKPEASIQHIAAEEDFFSTEVAANPVAEDLTASPAKPTAPRGEVLKPRVPLDVVTLLAIGAAIFTVVITVLLFVGWLATQGFEQPNPQSAPASTPTSALIPARDFDRPSDPVVDVVEPELQS